MAKKIKSQDSYTFFPQAPGVIKKTTPVKAVSTKVKPPKEQVEKAVEEAVTMQWNAMEYQMSQPTVVKPVAPVYPKKKKGKTA